MAATSLIEESPRLLGLLRHLESHGALEPGGYQVAQPELSADVNIPGRTLKTYIARLEGYGALHVTRTTVDGDFGTPRACNVYRLKVDADTWEQKLAPEIVAARRARTDKVVTAKRNVRKADKLRKQGRRPDGTPHAVRPPAPPVVADADVELLAQGYLDSGEDLTGW